MLFESFFRKLICRQPRRRPSPKRLWPSLLRLESLEDRLTPSCLTVSNNTDSGAGSLRYEVAAAASGDTIVFASSVHAITLTSGEIDLTENLNIVGPGNGKLTISGDGSSRVFHVETGSTVTISNLTIADGQASGPLPASMVGVFSGTGTGAGGGGGILNEAGAHLTLNNDTFNGNQAIHGPSPLAFTVLGGGLLNLGSATVVACEFSNNEALGGNALDAIGGSAGGGIDNFGGPTGGASLTVVNSTFDHNSAVAAGGGFFFGIGGALDSNAGLNGYDPTQAQPSIATVTNSSFVNNLATGGPNAIANAGALLTEGDGVKMTLVGCTVNGNRSVGGGGGDGITTGDSEGIAGGIMCGTNTFLNIVGCTITNNLALGGNNAIPSDTDPFAGGAFGGGIENNFLGVLNIADSMIANNTAQGGATSQGPGGDAIGGGISNSPGATMNMTNCIVSGNSAIAGQGGPGVNSQLVNAQAGFGFGGGVDTSRGSTATIIGSMITGNKAVGGAGGKGNQGGNGYGGGLSVGFGTLTAKSPDGSQLTVISSVVENNQALGGAGGAGANGGNGYGGGLAIMSTCSATVTASAITNNDADGGHKGSGHSTQDGQGIGGGVYNLGTFTNVVSVIKNNDASTSDDDIFSV